MNATEKYTDGGWMTVDQDYHVNLDIEKSGEYKKFISGPGSFSCTGKYTVQGEYLILHAGEKSWIESFDCNAKKCQIKPEKESVYSRERLQCGNKESYLNFRKPRNPGEEIKIGATPAITMGAIQGRLLSSMKVREKPSIKAKSYVFHISNDGEDEKTYYALPNGEIVTLLAKTTHKHKVGNHENYWYYCSFSFQYDLGNREGWVFGQWIDVKDGE